MENPVVHLEILATDGPALAAFDQSALRAAPPAGRHARLRGRGELHLP
ncbi:MAG: hypothetical protein ACRDZ8_04155 [Acidimicrobiales bacterium]